MASSTENQDRDPRTLADLSALADGSLDPERRADVQARIAASPQLSALYTREQRVVEVLHQTSRDTHAPAALRARIAADRPGAGALARRRFVWGGGLAGALAAIVLALVLILPAGTPGGPSVSQAASLAVLGPIHAAPAADPSTPDKLGAAVGEVYFPNWAGRFGWRAIGERTDRIGGRLAVTVYYSWRGKRVAYTIVAAPALRAPAASVRTLGGTELRTLRLHGRMVVTWRRAAHTCVLSGRGVPASVLQQLAAWKTPNVGA
jgi:hypothetical protein